MSIPTSHYKDLPAPAGSTLTLDMIRARKRMMDEQARLHREGRDSIISRAVSSHLGREDWIPEDLEGRMARVTFEGCDLETITIDGKPIVVFGSIKAECVTEGDKVIFKAGFGYRILNEPSV